MSPRSRRLALLCVTASVLGGLASVQACGGGSTNADAGLDSGSDATVADSPSDTQQQNDGNAFDDAGCPIYSGSTPLCKALAQHCHVCGPSSLNACGLKHFSTVCEGIAPSLSQAFTNASVACGYTCDTSCIPNALIEAGAGYTAAQTKVATDYCNTCSDAGGCVNFEEQTLNIQTYSDSVCNQIDSKCAPDSSAACSGYNLCADLIIGNTAAGLCDGG